MVEGKFRENLLLGEKAGESGNEEKKFIGGEPEEKAIFFILALSSFYLLLC